MDNIIPFSCPNGKQAFSGNEHQQLAVFILTLAKLYFQNQESFIKKKSMVAFPYKASSWLVKVSINTAKSLAGLLVAVPWYLWQRLFNNQ